MQQHNLAICIYYCMFEAATLATRQRIDPILLACMQLQQHRTTFHGPQLSLFWIEIIPLIHIIFFRRWTSSLVQYRSVQQLIDHIYAYEAA